MGKSASTVDDESSDCMLMQEKEKSQAGKSYEDKRVKESGRVQMDETQLQNLIFEALENTPVKGFLKEHQSPKDKSKAKRTTSESANNRPEHTRRPARRVATHSEYGRSHRDELRLTKNKGGSMRSLGKVPEVIAKKHSKSNNMTGRTKKHDSSDKTLDPSTILSMLENFATDDDAKAAAFMAHLKNANIKPKPPAHPPKHALRRSQASFAA